MREALGLRQHGFLECLGNTVGTLVVEPSVQQLEC
jgi:hypothetical protein